MTLESFLLEILGIGGVTGSASYPVALWIFSQIEMSPSEKRWMAYAVSFGLAALAWLGMWVFGYAEVTPDAVFTSAVTAFATSQALHGLIDLPKKGKAIT